MFMCRRRLQHAEELYRKSHPIQSMLNGYQPAISRAAGGLCGFVSPPSQGGRYHRRAAAAEQKASTIARVHRSLWNSFKKVFLPTQETRHEELLDAIHGLKQQIGSMRAAQAASHTALQTLLSRQPGNSLQPTQTTSSRLIQGGGILSSAIEAASVQFAAPSPAVPAARKPSTPHPSKAQQHKQTETAAHRAAVSFAHPRASAPAHSGPVSSRSVTFSVAVAPSRKESPSSAGSWKSAASLSRKARRRGTPAPPSFKSHAELDTSAASAAHGLNVSDNSAPRSPGYSTAPPSPVRAPQFDASITDAAAPTGTAAAPARKPHPLLAAGLGPGALMGARAQLKRAPRAAPKPRAGVRRPMVGLAGIAAAAAAMAERRAAAPAAASADDTVNASTWSSPGLGRPAVTPGAKLRRIAPSGPKAFPALSSVAEGPTKPAATAAAAAAAATAAAAPSRPVGGVKRSWADIARARTAQAPSRLPPPPTAASSVTVSAPATRAAPAAAAVSPAPAARAPPSTPTIRGFGAADLLAAKHRLKSGSKAPRAASRDRARAGAAVSAGKGKGGLHAVLTAALARRFAHANPEPSQRPGKAARNSMGDSPATSVASSWDGSDAENSPAPGRAAVKVTQRPSVVPRGSPLRHTANANAATPLWRKPRSAPAPKQLPSQADSPKIAGVSIRPAQRVEALLSPVRASGTARRVGGPSAAMVR